MGFEARRSSRSSGPVPFDMVHRQQRCRKHRKLSRHRIVPVPLSNMIDATSPPTFDRRHWSSAISMIRFDTLLLLALTNVWPSSMLEPLISTGKWPRLPAIPYPSRKPRWPLQTSPPLATQTPPGRTAKLSMFWVLSPTNCPEFKAIETWCRSLQQPSLIVKIGPLNSLIALTIGIGDHGMRSNGLFSHNRRL